METDYSKIDIKTAIKQIEEESGERIADLGLDDAQILDMINQGFFE